MCHICKYCIGLVELSLSISARSGQWLFHCDNGKYGDWHSFTVLCLLLAGFPDCLLHMLVTCSCLQFPIFDMFGHFCYAFLALFEGGNSRCNLTSANFSVFLLREIPKTWTWKLLPSTFYIYVFLAEKGEEHEVIWRYELVDSRFNSCWWVFPKTIPHLLWVPRFNSNFWCCHPSHKCRHTPTPSSRPRDGNCLNSRVSSRNSRTMTRESTEASGPNLPRFWLLNLHGTKIIQNLPWPHWPYLKNSRIKEKSKYTIA